MQRLSGRLRKVVAYGRWSLTEGGRLQDLNHRGPPFEEEVQVHLLYGR